MGVFRLKESQIGGLRKDLELLNANYSDALENNVALSKSEETSKRIIETLTKNNEEVSFLFGRDLLVRVFWGGLKFMVS